MRGSSANRPAPSTFDHDQIVRDALQEAEQVCKRAGARFTPIRRRVLQIVWSQHRPIGAYNILEELRKAKDVQVAIAPPTVYRALDFLRTHSLVHRIASRNAYVGCSHSGKIHTAQFLLCEDCGRVTEIASEVILGSLAREAESKGFQMGHSFVEISGYCHQCREETPA